MTMMILRSANKSMFTIQFVAAGYTADKLDFVPDVTRKVVGGSIARDLSLPDWKLLRYEALPLPYQSIEEFREAGFAFRFEAERYVAYYIWQIVLPLAVVVVMSWTAAGGEIGVGPSIVIVDEGIARSLTTTTAKEDVYAFFFGQKGLMAGLGL